MKENLITCLPLKVYRYLRWRRTVNREYRHNRACFSEEYARICLEAAKAVRRNASTEQVLAACEKKDAYIIRYLENLCGDVIAEYKQRQYPVHGQDGEKKIWVFWWTGEETAPDIVKACIRSIRNHAAGHEVVLLDQNNYGDYVTLPDEILRKHREQKISHAHFSDMIRLSLLAAYGGVWIDATVYLSQQLPDCVFAEQFYTLKSENLTAPYYSKSRWCGYFLAGNSGFGMFPFVRDLLIAYWERSDTVIDYLLMDYMFGIACKHNQDIQRAVLAVPDNNTRRGDLMNAINEPYTEALFETLATRDTFASKLSWRYGNPRPCTEDGKLTNYGYLLNEAGL